MIDTEDLEKVKYYCWRIDPKGYVVANSRNGENKMVRIHRIITGVDEEHIVDHINWNTLDNRKENLRIATKTQNNINIKRRKNNRSGYTGVSLLKNGKYVAAISINKKKIYLGTFNNLEDAVLVRHKAELLIHNEWSGEINRQDFNRLIEIAKQGIINE